MAIPNIAKQNIIDALKFIDENKVPSENQSTEYNLVNDDGKRYPPKYVIAVADHLANQAEISTDGFNSVEAKAFLEKQGFKIESKRFKLTITANSIVSTDNRFTMNNLSLGNAYKPVDACYKKADGTEIRRAYKKGERKHSNQTMPRIACQIFEKQIDALSAEEKKNFPVCQYSPGDPIIRGIFPSVAEFDRNTLEYLIYNNGDKTFVIYCWNIFTTIIFVQECIKRFGEPDDEMVLVYIEKSEKEKRKGKKESDSEEQEIHIQEELVQSPSHQNAFSDLLIEAKNIIFRGAPGTGKTYLAQEIAADIISDGRITEIEDLRPEEKEQYGFVQFHPSYDYSDFVEGLRPIIKNDSMVFELRDGIFKKFVNRARENYENHANLGKITVKDALRTFFDKIEMGKTPFKLQTTHNIFYITEVDETNIYISIPKNEVTDTLKLRVSDITRMLESNDKLEQVKDVTKLFKKTYATQAFSYDLVIYKEIKKIMQKLSKEPQKMNPEGLKKYVFIIDEINRGEISKIFGELFFAIDPGYRGPKGKVSTQYEYMHESDEKFYIPENVYIIGTMNDIDRSVDSFDFAMRRRFRFVELKASEQIAMLSNLDDDVRSKAIYRMTNLNNVIANTEGLNENYHIGPAYFRKLEQLDFDDLWNNCLQPLLEEYVRGMYNEKDCMKNFEDAYNLKKHVNGAPDDKDQGNENQG